MKIIWFFCCTYRCPLDPSVFPALGLSRSGDGLEVQNCCVFLNFFKNTLHLFQTNFYAFKIPESNFLVFEATVTTCRGGCQPVSK